MSQTKFYNLGVDNKVRRARNKSRLIKTLSLEANTCRKQGDYLQEMALGKVIKKLQKELDDNRIENFKQNGLL